jgi:hypothetical protein
MQHIVKCLWSAFLCHMIGGNQWGIHCCATNHNKKQQMKYRLSTVKQKYHAYDKIHEIHNVIPQSKL